MHAMGDLELVAAVQAGDTEAYGQLFERYQSKIYNFTYGILGNAEDARDVTQDAFVRVFEALPRKEHVEFSAYLYRAARNAAYDVAKARGRYAGPDDLDVVHEDSMYADPERATLFCEQQEVVRDAMSALSDDHRAILMLREVQELSYQEIADALDMTRTNVGVTIMRARLKFKGAFRMSHVDVDALCAECQAMLPKLSAYIDDELKPEERVKVDAHLDDCPLCRYALDEMRESSKSYRAFVPLIPPEAMRAEVLWRVSRLSGGVESPAGEGGGAAEAGGGAGTQGATASVVSGGPDGLADGRGGGADDAGAARRISSSAGTRLAAVLGVLAGLAIGFIVLGLLSTPRELPDPVTSWGAWRGRLRAPAAAASDEAAAPTEIVGEEWAEDPVVDSGSDGSSQESGGSQNGASTTATRTIPGFTFVPKLYLVIPSKPDEPELY